MQLTWMTPMPTRLQGQKWTYCGSAGSNWVTLLFRVNQIGSEKVADAIEDLTSLLIGFSLVSTTGRNAVDLHGAGINALSTHFRIQKYINQTEKDRGYVRRNWEEEPIED
jgi:hypothetical protein